MPQRPKAASWIGVFAGTGCASDDALKTRTPRDNRGVQNPEGVGDLGQTKCPNQAALRMNSVLHALLHLLNDFTVVVIGIFVRITVDEAVEAEEVVEQF